ncbi:MAG: NADP-dependent oxidoreductase [Alphaproteobacteria bacterium]|jgi:NADPH-dependent curcumin reductase CurA|nr:NADP-dependent oxidoreductase [Alphaproteobacteria bacterium]
MAALAKVQSQVRLRSRPTGIPAAADFQVTHGPVTEPAEGEIVVRNRFLSVEPAMRGWVADLDNYAPPVAIGAVMRAFAAGEVVASRHQGYAEGDRVMGMFGWQEYATVPAGAVTRKVVETDLPLSLSLGVLGINGVSAYFGLTDIGRPVRGETVLVSTAAGAVGSAVGQIAKVIGCRTVGLAGGPDKTRMCTDVFGFDAALDYKALDDGLGAAVAATCPDGIDVYFDNVAGAISDAVVPHLALRGRVVVCGTASIAQWNPRPSGPRRERILLTRRARMEGFVVFDYQDRYEEAVGHLAGWVRDGRLRYAEDFLDGIDACPDAIAGLYRGSNLGKRIIRLD